MTDCILVIPCYNEAARLDVEAFWQFSPAGTTVRFVLVDDGSTDATPAVLDSLCGRDPRRFDVLHLPRNGGKAEAVRRGILRALEANPRAVGFWDADLATPLDALPDFLALLWADPRRQIVIGSRIRLLGRSIDRCPLRHGLGRAFALTASAVLGLRVCDTQCGAKLFRVGPDMRRLFAVPFRATWIFDVELLARFLVLRRASGATPPAAAIYEQPLARWREVAGSKVRCGDFLAAVGQLASIYWAYLRPGAATPSFLQETGHADPAVATRPRATSSPRHAA